MSVFGQHIEHNVDLELTLSYLLGLVPWSLSTPDKIFTKIDKFKLLHLLQSHIEPTIDWSCSAAHIFMVMPYYRTKKLFLSPSRI